MESTVSYGDLVHSKHDGKAWHAYLLFKSGPAASWTADMTGKKSSGLWSAAGAAEALRAMDEAYPRSSIGKTLESHGAADEADALELVFEEWEFSNGQCAARPSACAAEKYSKGTDGTAALVHGTERESWRQAFEGRD